MRLVLAHSFQMCLPSQPDKNWLEGIEIVCLCPSTHLGNCSDQVIDMAQVQQIYARLFTHIDAATSLLLKQDFQNGPGPVPSRLTIVDDTT